MKSPLYIGIGLLLSLASCKSIKNAGHDPIDNKPHNTDLLHVQEETTGGKSILLTSDMKVVEPNSTLTVTIDIAALSNQLAGTSLPPDITAKLNLLLAMVQQQQEAMQDVTEALLINAKDPKSPDWKPYMHKLGGFVRLIANDPQTHAIFNASLPANPTIPQQYQTLFTTATKYIAQLQDQIQQEAKANGVYLQLGAFLNTKSGQTPIHIPGYDDYTSQPSSVVEQFQYTLTAAQQKDLTAISALAIDANKKGLSAALKDAVDTNGGLLEVLPKLSSYKTAVAIEDSLDSIVKTGSADIAALKAPVTDAYQSLQSFVDYLDNMVRTYSSVSSSITPDQLLLNVNNSINDLMSKTTTLKKSLTTDVTTIQSVSHVADNYAMKYVRSLSGQLNGLADSFQNDLTHLKTNITDLLNTAISGHDLTNATYDFTNKVKQLSIDPSLHTAVINLELAGARDEGNTVTIKLATAKAGQPVEERALLQYHLYFCSLYARTTTGFLFVNPEPLLKTTNSQALFRYSPSYSILLKGFWKGSESSRKNLSYHSIFNPGLGVNFAALTFNPNGSTELGIGGVATLFNDFFQAGYGFNTVSGVGYMFFGFKIPVGSFSFH